MLFMLIILLIAFAGAAALVFAVYRQNRALPSDETRAEMPREAVTLFADDTTEANPDVNPSTAAAALIARAAQGDLATLAEASQQAALYDDVLNALIDWYERQANLTMLVRHITRSDGLRGNVRLAERVIAAWATAPDRRSTVEMLHLAALADDPNTYRRAVDLAVEAFKAGRLKTFSADELLALVESQMWVLASQAQRGGDGFTLKQRLAEARRELAAAASAK
ncbi:MAG: hypothetical protein ACJ74J_18910 [Blastocatellia bacterium]